jgi:type II secretory pathway component PulF
MSNAPLVVSSKEVPGTAVKKGSAWITAKASERSEYRVALRRLAWMMNSNAGLYSCAAITQAYSSDPKFKKYIQQVEKCLNSFDDVHEWADCIAFLKQLLKVSS